MKKVNLFILAILSLNLISCKTTQEKKSGISISGVPFASYDSNSDGFVDREELDNRAKIAFNVIDIDGSGGISWSEFRTMGDIAKAVKDKKESNIRSKMPQQLVEKRDKDYKKRVKKRFLDMDANHDDKIVLSEYLNYKDNAANFIMAADKDGDGLVSEKEIELNMTLRMLQAIGNIQDKLKTVPVTNKK